MAHNLSTALSTAAGGAAAGAQAAAMSGMPPGEVIAWAVIGGLVSAWLSQPKAPALDLRWALAVLAHIGVSASAGVVISALLIVAAPSFPALALVADEPRWAVAAVVAAAAHTVGPWVWQKLREKMGMDTPASAGTAAQKEASDAQ